MAMITLQLGNQTLGTHAVSVCPYIVGREMSCDLPIDNIGVSRNHCRYTFEDGVYYVEDMGSSNGTLVNGDKISKPTRVEDGDEVKIGKFSMLFAVTDTETPPRSKDDALPEVEPEEKPAYLEDNMKTFQMNTDDLKAAAVAAAGKMQSGGRASDLAEKYSNNQDTVKLSGGVSKKTFITTIIVGGLVVAGLVVAVILLAGK